MTRVANAFIAHTGLARHRSASLLTGLVVALSAGVAPNGTALAQSLTDDGSRLIIAKAAQRFPADPAVPVRPVAIQNDLTPGAGDTRPAAKLDPVQTAALYFYAKERRIDRVEAEIARLQALHPGFMPPQDLYVAADEVVPDETSLWAMFAADDFTAIDAEIIRRKTSDPSWLPTADFQSKLARKKQRVRMKELAEAEDWAGIINVSASIDPASESDVDLVWMNIDALSATGDRTALAAALRGLLMREGEARLPDEHLVVTLQKALRDFPASEIERLAATLWPQAGGATLPGPVRLDLARKQVAEFNSEKNAALVPPETLKLLASQARASREPEDLSLLGWHELKAEQPQRAGDWFEIAMQADPNPENAKGMYLSLARQDRDKEAYTFAVKHLPDLSDDPVFLMNVLSPRFGNPDAGEINEAAVLAYSTAIMETDAADHAEILGWYAYNSRQFEAAEAWFRQSYEWETSADRLKGLALTFLRRDKKSDYAALKRDFAEIYPDIWPEIQTEPAPAARSAAAVKAPARDVKPSYIKHFNARNHAACLREIDRLGSAGGKPSVMLIRGWCELGLQRFGDARLSFEAAMAGRGKVRSDAVYGAGLSLLGARLTDEAEALITAWPLSAARDRELKAEIYYQRARSAFNHRQYDRVLRALDARAQLIAEPRDLTQMRAWAHYHSGQPERAKAVFRQLNMVIRDTGAIAAMNLIDSREER